MTALTPRPRCLFLMTMMIFGTVPHVACGDILPPPPPSPVIPGMQMELPSETSVIISGVLLTLATGLAAFVVAKKYGSGSAKRGAAAFTVVVLSGVVSAAFYTHQQHEAHKRAVQEIRNNYSRSERPEEWWSDEPVQPTAEATDGIPE